MRREKWCPLYRVSCSAIEKRPFLPCTFLKMRPKLLLTPGAASRTPRNVSWVLSRASEVGIFSVSAATVLHEPHACHHKDLAVAAPCCTYGHHLSGLSALHKVTPGTPSVLCVL